MGNPRAAAVRGAKKALLAVLAAVGLVFAVACWPFGVWLLDIFDDRVHTLGQCASPSGDRFYAIQHYLGSGDYSLEILRVTRDGQRSIAYLDSDSIKVWRMTLRPADAWPEAIWTDSAYGSVELNRFSPCGPDERSPGCTMPLPAAAGR